MAAYYWVERVIKADRRVDIIDAMIGIDPRALKGLQQTQPHTDCQHGNP